MISARDGLVTAGIGTPIARATGVTDMIELPFRDRAEAGQILGAELASRNLVNAVVLALPRGGVAVAKEVADALKAPLDVVVVRKLGVPWQPELAMGAISSGVRVLDAGLIADLRISSQQIEIVATKESQEIARREKLYRGDMPPINLCGKTIVLVDDGLATGSTMMAAVRCVRNLDPGRVIVAAPVCSAEACSRLTKEADECVWLAQPEPFCAVGQWYEDFHQATDAEVQKLLKHGRSTAELR